MRSPTVYSAAIAPKPLNVLGERVNVFTTGDGSAPFEAHLQTGNRGGGPPLHHHPWDEAFYVLAGEVQLTLEDASHHLTVGAFAHIPAHCVHAYENLTDGARLLAIVSDPQGGKLFAAMDEQVRQMPQDASKLAALNARFGVHFV